MNSEELHDMKSSCKKKKSAVSLHNTSEQSEKKKKNSRKIAPFLVALGAQKAGIN